jgi:hypothetical protein
MVGGPTQLISVGIQDVFLTGNPTKSLWKRDIIRRTNFAIESIENVFTPTWDSNSTITIKKNGDLLKSCILEITMKKSNIDSFYPAEQLIKTLTLTIGGQTVQKIEDFPTWVRVHDELFNSTEERAANYRMLNFRDNDPVGAIRTFYLTLPMYFSEHVSKSLPLIALQYHDIITDLEFQNPSNIPGIDSTYTPMIRFYGDYVFLDKMERTYFAESQHEYVIEQLQTLMLNPAVGESIKTIQYTVNFNFPTRYLVWVFKTNLHGIYTTSNNQFENNEAYAPLYAARLQINGTDRFTERNGSYFNLVQPLQAIGRVPSVGIYMYSFGLDVTSPDSSGTLNFSSVDTVTLSLTTKAATEADISTVINTTNTLSSGLTKFQHIIVFGKSFNVLRVKYGQGGVLFSN